MNADRLMDSIRSVTVSCMDAIENRYFQELFLLMQQRSELLQTIYDSQIELNSSFRDELLIGTKMIHELIEKNINLIHQQLEGERATATVRRAYAKSVKF